MVRMEKSATTRLGAKAAMSSSVATVALLCIALGPLETAWADEGTHFLVEAQAGVAAPLNNAPEGVGFGLGGIAGFGGRVTGTPLRLYGLLSYTHVGIEGRAFGNDVSWDQDELSFGIRALFLLWEDVPVRIFGDVLGTLFWLETVEDLGDEVLILDDVDPRGGVVVGGGVQYRPVLWFSAGVRMDLGVVLDEDGLDRSDMTLRLLTSGTVTLHF